MKSTTNPRRGCFVKYVSVVFGSCTPPPRQYLALHRICTACSWQDVPSHATPSNFLVVHEGMPSTVNSQRVTPSTCCVARCGHGATLYTHGSNLSILKTMWEHEGSRPDTVADSWGKCCSIAPLSVSLPIRMRAYVRRRTIPGLRRRAEDRWWWR